MEKLKIRKITEEDFDKLIAEVGGTRITEPGSVDYLLNEALIELKLVEEEGLKKENRQRKIAAIFRQNQPDVPTVSIDPKRLDEAGAHAYYRAVAGPIQTCVKKAASQLDATNLRHHSNRTRVAIVLNNGYTTLNGEEFNKICTKIAQNDTRRIDRLIVGGIYFYSDGFDQWFLAGFSEIPINLSAPFPSFDLLQKRWNEHVHQILRPPTLYADRNSGSHFAVGDLAFTLDGVTFVRAAEATPESSFWPNGEAPRKNSSGIEKCPPIGIAFPRLAQNDWINFRKKLRDAHALRPDYISWRTLEAAEEVKEADCLCPFVAVPISFGDFRFRVESGEYEWQFADVCSYAAQKFSWLVRKTTDTALDLEASDVLPLEYVRLDLTEIGRDKAYDYASIYHVSRMPGFEKEVLCVNKRSLFWEYAICLASVYAVKLDVPHVLYRKVRG